MLVRKIVHIDQQRCDGCGDCVPSCAEGAIQIVDGKARLVSDIYCDGLGACLGHCPRGAITVIEREAAPFDEEATLAHVAAQQHPGAPAGPPASCPGTAVRNWGLNILADGPALLSVASRASPAASAPDTPPHASSRPSDGASQLVNWPIQLHLAPPNAPFLHEADLLLVADCVSVAHPDFHRRFLTGGRPVLIGCPKLDDGRAYVDKLARMMQTAPLRSVTVLHMEVPCCTGLLRIAQAAAAQAGGVPVDDIVVAIDGRERDGHMPPRPAASHGAADHGRPSA